MKCSRCGFENEPGAAFCSHCGEPLVKPGASEGNIFVPPQGFAPSQNNVPPQGYEQQETIQHRYTPQGYSQQEYPPQGYPQPGNASQKKSRTGLIIGLIAGGVALLGVLAVVYFVFLSGPKQTGVWVCDERGWALKIEERVLTEYSPAGINVTNYTYSNGNGKAELYGGDASFSVQGDRMDLTDEETGDRYLFTRQGADTNLEDVVISGFNGLWSSEELGDVIEMDENGVLKLYSDAGEADGHFGFEIKNARGTIVLGEDAYAFTADWDALTVETVGAFSRAKKNLDVAAFIQQFGNPLVATWYETTGQYGSITFNSDGTFSLELYGQTATGNYTYDSGTGTGTITSDKTDGATGFAFADGTLTLEGMTYTQQYVEQPGADDLFTAIEGVWYDTTTPDEIITFYSDYSAEMGTGGDTYTGTFTFNPLDLTGILTVSDGTSSADFDFYVENGILNVDDQYQYSRAEPSVTEESVGTVLGTWYDTAGYMGTLYFDKEGLVIAETSGIMFYGTYTFDESAGSGSMTIQYDEGPIDFDMYLWGGMLYTDQATYTQDEVEQAS